MEVLTDVTGVVWKVLHKQGDHVQAGDTLVIVESMKMEIPIEAPEAGVLRILVSEGDQVEEGMKVAEIEEP